MVYGSVPAVPAVRIILPPNLPNNLFYNFLSSSSSFSLLAIGSFTGFFAQAVINRRSSLKSRAMAGTFGFLLSGIFQYYVRSSESFRLYTAFKKAMGAVQSGQDASPEFPKLVRMLAPSTSLDTKYHEIIRKIVQSSTASSLASTPKAYSVSIPGVQLVETSPALFNNHFYNFLHSYGSFPLSAIGFIAAFFTRAALNRESSLRSRVLVGVVGFLLSRIFQRCIKRSTDYRLYKQFKRHVANGKPLAPLHLSSMLPCDFSLNTKYHEAILTALQTIAASSAPSSS